MKPIHSVQSMPSAYRKKELVVFDLDGTLTKTKSNLTSDVAALLRKLLADKKVAVISGQSYQQFKKQLIVELRCPPALLSNLFLFPTTATACYRYQSGWKKVYASEISKNKKAQIRRAFRDVFEAIHYVPPKKTYGVLLQDRGSAFAYSFLGQDVVAALGAKGILLKEKWTQENTPLKLKIAKMVQERLPDFEVHAAGFTTIDVTKKRIDKAYGIREIEKIVKIPVRNMLFVGDALFRGGNDAAARKSGIDCVAVKGPEETKRVIGLLL